MRLFDHPLALDWTCRHQDRPLVVEIGLEVVEMDSLPLEWTRSSSVGTRRHWNGPLVVGLDSFVVGRDSLPGLDSFVIGRDSSPSAPPALCNRLESLSRSPDNFVTTLRASAAPLTTSPSHPSLSQYLLPSPSSPSTHLFFYIYSSPAKVSAAFAAVINHHVCKRFHFFEWVKLHGKCELVFYVPPQSHLFASAPSCFVESSSVLHLR
ncbi:hypothetical protein PtB15_8B60 [Puccinia triticina]|nr:hypothetical protein PtB15_8B60 [Puccinia triticina]